MLVTFPLFAHGPPSTPELSQISRFAGQGNNHREVGTDVTKEDDKKRNEQKEKFSGTGNRTQGCSVRASDVSHYTIPDTGCEIALIFVLLQIAGSSQLLFWFADATYRGHLVVPSMIRRYP
ncbi:hypothetical protein V2G26_002779 [Clonostachys chloroleuca]